MRFASRVEYRERQRLSAGDLQAEQDYLLGLAGRHHVGPHTWGIVSGLHITIREHLAVVSPGVAIDGYGREIVVGEQVELSLKDSKEQFVNLHYCERPQGGCGGNANSRWRDVAEVFVTEERLPIPETDPDLSIARAAGRLADYPPWPILLGAIALTIDSSSGVPESKFELEPFHEDYRLLGLRAARLSSPSGRALMRIGQENLADIYHYRITAQDESGVLQNRFAIDREGNNHLWGNLLLQGSGYSAVFVSHQQNLVLTAESLGYLGRGVLWRVVPGVDDDGNDTFEISFRERKAAEPFIKRVFKPGNEQSLRGSVRSFNATRVPILLKHSDARSSDGDAEERVASKPLATEIVDDRELPLPRSGAHLHFSPDKEATTVTNCGCRELDEQEPKLPKGFIFTPVTSAPTQPDSRDIYTIRTGTPESPLEEFRMSAGLLAKGDFTTRIAIGGSPEGKLFQSWLNVRGDRTVILPDGKRTAKGEAFDMIKVTGTTEYPPVKPDPRDPLFSFLLKFAFVNGIVSVNSSLIKVAVKAPPYIETGPANWSYKLEVQNLGLTEPMFPFLGVENIFSAEGMTHNEQLKLPDRVEKSSTAEVTLERKTADLPKGDEIQIEVVATMTAGTAKVGNKDRSAKIPVYDSPTIEDSVPESIDVGKATDFEVTILNGRSRKIRLNPIQIEGLGQPQSFPPVANELGPNEQTKTTKIAIPAQSSGAPDLQIKITVTYLWEGHDTTVVASSTKTVRVNEVVP